MSKTFRPYSPGQSFLLPPSPLEWLPEDHLARFVLDVVTTLDLSPIYRHYERQLRGQPPYHPQMMVGLLLYGYCVGVPSSRKIERSTYEDVAFRVIAGGAHPDHVSISEFRRVHLSSLAGLFVQVLGLCQHAGMVKLGHVALDGTKLKANASKHKAMSYERMKKQEEELRALVDKLLRQAEAADEAEDREHGRGRRGQDLPEDLRRAEGRLQRILDAKAALEAEARAQAIASAAAQSIEAQTDTAVAEMNNIRASRGDDDDDDEPPSPGGQVRPEQMPEHQVPTKAEGTIEPKAQRNFTDADSRIMKTGDGFLQGYNAQAVVDQEHQIIVAQDLSNQSPDAEHFVPMLDRVMHNCGRVPDKCSADSGYLSEANVRRAESRGIDVYVAPGRTRRGNKAAPAPTLDTDGSAKSKMRDKLATDEGAAIYARRKVIVEPVFGQIKTRGFRELLLRGIRKARAEWSLITLTHNLLKLYRFGLAA